MSVQSPFKVVNMFLEATVGEGEMRGDHLVAVCNLKPRPNPKFERIEL